MMAQYDDCELIAAIPERGLHAGARGFVVEAIAGGKAYFVEFCDESGATREVIYVEGDQIRPRTAEDLRPVKKTDPKHTRSLPTPKRYARTSSSTARATK